MKHDPIDTGMSQHFSHVTIEHSQDGIFWFDEKDRIFRANQSACRMLGYTREELTSMNLADIDPFYNQAEDQERRYGETPHSTTFESRHRRKDGTVYPVEVTSNYFTYEGRPCSCAFFRDITARKQAEKQLKQALAELQELKNRLEAENIYLQEEIRGSHNVEELIGDSQAMRHVLAQTELVAATDASVLILGETGTGKELVARAVHTLSRRRDRPLVKVNCAALPAHLMESELFGHEKGAFTGATSTRAGRFELADGGTLFLDEIGDLPTELQAKLLRVLQEGEFERLGDMRTRKVDVRIIAATNRNLEKHMAAGGFRQDLYYRLNVFPIHCPPLRERPGDIPLLAEHFVRKACVRLGKQITMIPVEVMENLLAYPWPGNVRELQNTLERAVIISPGHRLILGDRLCGTPLSTQTARISTLDEIQRRHILTVLEMTAWRVSGERGAARILGLKPTTLESRMKKLGIVRPT